jgi:Nucleotidyltransferase of unknown function (DUF6036)
MDRGDIERYLQLLGQELQARNTTGDILLLGGAVMLLEVGNRATTQDIDASFEGANASLIRQAIKIVAQQEGLAQDWLNDGAKGFLYSQPPTILWKHYPGLKVYIPSLDYILAMKIVASRPRDIEDVRALIQKLHIPNEQALLSIVSKYVPQQRIDVRIQYIIADLFES